MRNKMNTATKAFLDEMKGRIEASIKANMQELIIERLSHNLSVLEGQAIISKADANEYRKENGIPVTPTKRERTPISDPCGSPIARGSSC